MASTIAAITTGVGGVVTTADATGNLSLLSGTTTVVAVTSTGASVTGTLSATGVSTFAAGTALLPALTTTGDTNTGVWFPAADTIAASTGGTERMRIDSSGNVGIGTSSPSEKLTLGGSANMFMSLISTGSIKTQIKAADANGYGGVGTVTNHAFAIETNNTERMRIDSSGTVLMGQTTNPATATLVLKVPTGTANGVNAQITSNTGTSYPFSNYNASSSYVGGISCTSSATAFPTSSDVRLKKNITDAPSAMGKILSAQVVSHDWINDEAHVDYGFVAQDLQDIIPQAVIEGTDKEDGSMDMPWGVDYSKIVPLLVKSIQELKAIIDTQAERIKALEAK